MSPPIPTNHADLAAYEVYADEYPFNDLLGIIFVDKGDNQDSDALYKAIRLYGGHPVVHRATMDYVVQ